VVLGQRSADSAWNLAVLVERVQEAVQHRMALSLGYGMRYIEIILNGQVGH
jgi:hypothetical protein